MAPPRRGVGLGIAGGGVKDVGVVGPAEAAVTVDFGAELGGSGGWQRQRSSMRGWVARPPAAVAGRGGPPVAASAGVTAVGENWSTIDVQPPRSSILFSLATPATHKLETRLS